MNEFERRLLADPKLPTLPAVAQKILELSQNADAELVELARVLQAEPALSARVIELANSSVYGLSREIATLREAVLYLGLKTVRSVALSFSFLSAFQRGLKGESLLELLWRLSLMRALAARGIAAASGRWEPEEAFLAGLVSGTGSFLLFQTTPEYPQIVARFERGEGDLIELEALSLETDNGRLAVLLLETWSFPPALLEPIRSAFRLAGPEIRAEVVERGQILVAADLATRALLVPSFHLELLWLERRISQMVGIEPVQSAELLRELPLQLEESAELFSIPRGGRLGYEELLERANRALVEQSKDSERGARELARALSALSRPDKDGPLVRDNDTGMLSLEAFERLLGAFHKRSSKTRRPLGLLVLEVENWKSFTVEVGPERAHAVIRGIGHQMMEVTRATDPNARVAEHQLALLAPGCAREHLRIIAERIRVRLEQSRGDEASLELSFGLAGTLPWQDDREPRALLRSAFHACEQARRAPDRIALA